MILIWTVPEEVYSSLDNRTGVLVVILFLGIFLMPFLFTLLAFILGIYINCHILANGVAASATIIQVTDTKQTFNDDPVLRIRLEVYPSNQPPFYSEAHEIVSRIEVHEYQSGAIVEVKYDPKSKDVAVVGIKYK